MLSAKHQSCLELAAGASPGTAQTPSATLVWPGMWLVWLGRCDPAGPGRWPVWPGTCGLAGVAGQVWPGRCGQAGSLNPFAAAHRGRHRHVEEARPRR
eukprot:354004-Chlamydomonas_euryale.AAC.2